MKNLDYFHNALTSSFKYLSYENNRKLINDIHIVASHLSRASFRIAFLAPFNFGKSTLINALLGSELLPSKAVRTTGLAISIKYGKEVETIITLQSGEIIRQYGTSPLKEFAILTRKGNRRLDVYSIELLVPSKFLKNGIELVDLPGTNDSKAQDELVKDELLKSDLVIQVLDANQSFTLDEQEKNKKWLMERGIKTSIFVINKMNKVEDTYDRKEILENVNENLNLVSTFRLKGVSSVYRIDALPALKSAKNKEFSKLIKSGIVDFKANLQTLVYFQQKNNEYHRMLRVNALSKKIEVVLKDAKNVLENEVKDSENIRISVIDKAKKREAFFQKNLYEKVALYRKWLSLDTLLKTYELKLAESLEKNTFIEWEKERFKSKVLSYIYSINNVLLEACQEFSKKQPQEMSISFPACPKVKYPSHQSRTYWEYFNDAFNGGRNKRRLAEKYERDKWRSYKQAARQYLSQYSRDAVMSLDNFEAKAKSAIMFKVPSEPNFLIQKRAMISDIDRFINKLTEIESCINRYENQSTILSIVERIKVAIILLKNRISCILTAYCETSHLGV